MKLKLAMVPVISPMVEIRSRKVRRILKLEARAQKLLSRYETAHTRIEPWKHKGEELLRQAHEIEFTLNGGQLGELRRARSEQ
ncbi:MAG: hypothetical protein ACE5JI_20150 [Acidobacteriota bacterium]